MKLTCDRSQLMAAINIVSRSAAAKSPILALEGILLEAGPESLQLTGFDLKTGVYTTIEAEVAEQGTIVLGARIFGDIVRSLPTGDVSIATDKNLQASIKGVSSDFSITGTSSDEYPELPSIDSRMGVSLPQNILGDMIRQTIFAVSDNEARPIYTGEHFEIDQGELTVMAVDGYRLALRREKVDDTEQGCEFIVPGKALSDLEKLCGESDEPVKICLGSKHISFLIGRTVLISRRLDGDFISYDKAVPSQSACEIGVERTKLQRTVERVSLIIDDRVKNPIRCVFSDHSLKISCTTALGRAEDVCETDGDGAGLEIGFNNKYILDALKAAPADELRICLNTSSSPCVIRPANKEDNSFTYMILPVRLRAE